MWQLLRNEFHFILKPKRGSEIPSCEVSKMNNEDIKALLIKSGQDCQHPNLHRLFG